MSFSGLPFPNIPSLPASGFFGLSSAELGELGPGLIKATRLIQDLVADVTVEERGDDRLTITQQPVEKTAAITDHAFKEPPIVVILAGWSLSSPSAQGDPNYARAIYQQLLDYQENVELLTVLTGKREYENMLLAELEVVTDQDSEYALMARMVFQHVILVETQVTEVPNNSVQKNPESTGNTADRGTQNAQPNTKPNVPAATRAMQNSAPGYDTTAGFELV